MTSPLILTLIFAAAAALLLAVVLLVRDLFARRELRPEELPLSEYKRPEPEPAGRMNRGFYGLVETSGLKMSPGAALTLVFGLAVIGCAVPLVLYDTFLGAAAGAVLLPSLGVALLQFVSWRRLRAMQKNLPETLELMADAVRSGESLEQAVATVAEQAPSPLKEEFDYCAQQLRLGHAPYAVLHRMARRIPIAEFKVFATAVLVHRQTGGNLALLAQRLANSARDRGEFQGHVAAVTSGSRLSIVGLTVGTVVAVGILAWLRPEYLQNFLNHPFGPSLLITAAVLQLLGVLWVWRVMRVQF